MSIIKSSTSAKPIQEADAYSSEDHVTVLARSLARALDCLEFGGSVKSSSRAFCTGIHFHDVKVAQANRQIGRLWSALRFERGWDGVDAEPPAPEAIKAAQEMISRLAITHVPIPMATVGCEGQSNLYWESDDFFADVDIQGQNVSYTIDVDGQDQSFEEPLVDGFIPPRLLQILMDRYERKL